MGDIERLIEVCRLSISRPMVVDVASWTIGTLAEGERRDKTAILGGVYDWLCGIWKPERGGGVGKPAELIRAALANIFANAPRVASGELKTKPDYITGNQFTAAALAASMAAAVGIETRIRVGGDDDGWKAVWAEADPLQTLEKRECCKCGHTEDEHGSTAACALGDGCTAWRADPDGCYRVKRFWGYHMNLMARSPLGAVPEFPKYGTVELWGGVAGRHKSAERGDDPPPEGGDFVTLVPNSPEGIKALVGRMVDTINASVDDPTVAATAEEIVSRMDAADRQNPTAVLAAKYAWLRAHSQYRDDPYRRELLQTPARMIRMAAIPPLVMGAMMLPAFAWRNRTTLAATEIEPVESYAYGDCDELTTCGASLVRSNPIGLPVRLDVGGTRGMAWYHHIWFSALIAGRWHCMDATEAQYDEVDRCPVMEKRGHVNV